jgi:hypothetical protein
MPDRNPTDRGEKEDVREDEMVRGVAEEGEDEFEDTEDLDAEEEVEEGSS